MNATLETTVGELARENPAAPRVFEKLGIDYCCGGSQTLAQACLRAAVPLDRVLNALADAEREPSAESGSADWQHEPLSALIDHIRRTHHAYVRAEIARLAPLFEKVCRVHGGNHPELIAMRASFTGLAAELTTHMMKEEAILFPYIERMEEAVAEKVPVIPPPFGSVRNPVAMMMNEHDGAGAALEQMRRTSEGYQCPPDACASFQALYQALADFEADLHQHIHLENNILFPRAIAMENAR